MSNPTETNFERKQRWNKPSPAMLAGLARLHSSEVRLRINAALRTPEERARAGARSKVRWSDPNYRKRVAQALARRWENPSARRIHSAKMKQLWSRPGYREKVLKSRKITNACEVVKDKKRRSMGWVFPAEEQAIIEQIKTGRRYLDIGFDWLLSPSRVSVIAIRAGLRRRWPLRDEVRAQIIKTLRRKDSDYATIAAAFGLSKGTIYQIARRNGLGYGARPNRMHRNSPSRNLAIVERVQKLLFVGESYIEIACRLGITRRQVEYLSRKHKINPGNTWARGAAFIERRRQCRDVWQ